MSYQRQNFSNGDVLTAERLNAMDAGIEEAHKNLGGMDQQIADALQEAKDSGEFDGPQGEPGPAGADGYTPVKGEDYFTDDDIDEMVAAVISALPVYDGEVVEE